MTIMWGDKTLEPVDSARIAKQIECNRLRILLREMLQDLDGIFIDKAVLDVCFRYFDYLNEQLQDYKIDAVFRAKLNRFDITISKR